MAMLPSGFAFSVYRGGKSAAERAAEYEALMDAEYGPVIHFPLPYLAYYQEPRSVFGELFGFKL